MILSFFKVFLFLLLLFSFLCPWNVQIIAEINGCTAEVDSINVIGVSPYATNEYDPGIDIGEPPIPPGNYIQFYFPHPEWNNSIFSNFTKDIRFNDESLLSNNGILWVSEIISNMNGNVTLLFLPLDSFPECDLLLYYENQYHNISSEQSFEFDINAYETRTINILIGNCNFLDFNQVLTKGVDFDIIVYPNPFNNILSVDFLLENNSLVRLAVFNLLGYPVQELNQDLTLLSGQQSIYLNFNKLPSGIYFLRLYSEKITLTKKIVYIK